MICHLMIRNLKIFFVVAIVVVIVGIALKASHIFAVKEEPHFVCGTCEEEMHPRERKNVAVATEDRHGEMLFMKYCSSCHNVSTKKSTGPGLLGVLSRIPSKDWAYGFISNADSVIKSGDEYATRIFEENGKAHQPIFRNTLTHQDIDAILLYCDHSDCVSP